MVGTTGFEPATSWSQTKCSTRLSYVPDPIRMRSESAVHGACNAGFGGAECGDPSPRWTEEVQGVGKRWQATAVQDMECGDPSPLWDGKVQGVESGGGPPQSRSCGVRRPGAALGREEVPGSEKRWQATAAQDMEMT